MTTTPWLYDSWSTTDLVREDEALRWRMAELDTFPQEPECDRECIENGMAYLADSILDINGILEKRRELYRNQYAPTVRKTERTDIYRHVKAHVSVETLCARYGPILDGHGNRLKGRCLLPDHHDRTASFVVYRDQDTWHCYGCNRGGDVFHLAMYLYQEPSTIEAARRLAREFNCEPVEVVESSVTNKSRHSFPARAR